MQERSFCNNVSEAAGIDIHYGILCVMIGCIFLLNSAVGAPRLCASDAAAIRDSSIASDGREGDTASTGYKAIVRYEDGFLAAGTDGRIDKISVSGKIVESQTIPGENFTCLICDNQTAIVAGEHGAILVSSEKGKFRKIESGTDHTINSLTLFKGMIIAGANAGEILTDNGTRSFNRLNVAVRGNIVSLSSRNGDCYGATDEGEIIHTTDGMHWEIFDFNKVYAGYYKPCHFTRILAADMQIAVAGVANDGAPMFMFSNQGSVWSERVLNYTDEDGAQGVLTDRPNDIMYDASRDLFYLACNNGNVIEIPSCSHCNKLAHFTAEHLTGILDLHNTMMLVGAKFFIRAINLE